MSLTVDELGSADEVRWDGFVSACPGSQPHHLLGWRTVMARTYGYRSRYLVAKCGGEIAGVMPLFEVSSLLQGYHFTTMPGGVCTASEAAGLALVERAKALVVEHGARFLAIRDSRQRWDAGLATDSSQSAIVVDLSRGSRPIWDGLKGDLRRMVRKTREFQLEARVGWEQLDSFYAMFSAFARSCGTPVFGRKLLDNVAAAFGDQAWLLGIWKGQQMIGGGLQLNLGRTAFGIWGASLHEYVKLNPNQLFYWEVIDRSSQRGCHRVDLGRSRTDSGQHKFKLRWLGESVPVYQQFYLHKTRRMPTGAADAEEGSGRVMTRLWRRVPLPVTRALGPTIRRHIPFA